MPLSRRNRRSSGDCSIVTKPKVATRNHFRHPLADGTLCSVITSAARSSSVVSSQEAASAVVGGACPARAVAGGAGVMENGGLAAGGRFACDSWGSPVGGRLGFGGTCTACCRCMVEAAAGGAAQLGWAGALSRWTAGCASDAFDNNGLRAAESVWCPESCGGNGAVAPSPPTGSRLLLPGRLTRCNARPYGRIQGRVAPTRQSRCDINKSPVSVSSSARQTLCLAAALWARWASRQHRHWKR